MRFIPELLLSLALLAGSAGATVDPALLGLVMPDARALAGINVLNVKTSPFGTFLLNKLPQNDPDFMAFVDLTGFDPRRDLNEILFATVGGRNQGNGGLVLASGNFDPARIIAAAKSKGADVTNYNGFDVLNGGHKQPKSVAFLNSRVAIAGDAQAVREALDRKAGSGPLNANLMTQANQLSSTEDAWFVSTIPVSEFAGNMQDQNMSGMMKGDALRTIQQTSGGVRFTAEGANLTSEVVTASPEDARSLADVARFFMSFLSLGQRDPNTNKLRSLLGSLNLQTDNNVLKASLTVPEQQLEQFINSAPHSGAAGPQRRRGLSRENQMRR